MLILINATTNNVNGIPNANTLALKSISTNLDYTNVNTLALIMSVSTNVHSTRANTSALIISVSTNVSLLLRLIGWHSR